jgi:hypothetical protein
MDLNHDWKALNEVLFQSKTFSSTASSLVLIENSQGQLVDGVVSNGKPFLETKDDFQEAVSANKNKLDALAAKYGVDQSLVLNKTTLDHAIVDVAQMGTNYYQQLQRLREQVRAGSEDIIVSRKNFLLDFFSGFFHRFFPNRFNVLLFISRSEQSQGGAHPDYQALLLSYSNGKLDQFFEPDFSSLHENRLLNWYADSDAIGNYMSSRYMLPCYALLLTSEDWRACLEVSQHREKRGLKNPWLVFVEFFDQKRANIYPYNFLTRILFKMVRWHGVLALLKSKYW